MTDLSSGDFSVADIEAAYVRILPFVVRTPLLESEGLTV